MRALSKVALVLSCSLLGASVGGTARAAGTDSSDPVRWHDDWPRFRPVEYAATGVLAAGALVVTVAVPQPDPRWRGGILFDSSVRSGLVASSESGRATANQASNVLLYSTLALPVVADAAIAAWAVHGSSDTALQMTLVEAESFALALALEVPTKRLAARERPISTECRKNPGYDAACTQKLDGSFFSGHTNMTFTAAGLVCTNHLNLPLFGGGAADIAACAGALGLATTTGVLRIVADRHYASDVLTGAASGLLSGMFVPWLLHYRGSGSEKQTRAGLFPVLTPTYGGLAVVGQL